MHVVVMGCGRVGSRVARSLCLRGHSVAVIDMDAQAFRKLGPGFTGTTVQGVGFDRDTMIEAGVDRADAFAAVSSGDNSNIISARVARETFNVQAAVARIYDPERAEVYERLGITTVATVRWTVDRFMRVLIPESVGTLWRDPTGTVAMLEVNLNSGWVGHRVTELEAVTGARVGFLIRFGRGHLPTTNSIIQDGDRVHLLVTDDIRERAEHAVVMAPPDH